MEHATASPSASPLRRVRSAIHLPVQHFFLDLDEEDTNAVSPFWKQCQDIWETVQLDCVWGPMVSHPLLHLYFDLCLSPLNSRLLSIVTMLYKSQMLLGDLI
jgi:hypothetical protein